MAVPKEVYLGDGQTLHLEVNGVTITVGRTNSNLFVHVDEVLRDVINFAKVNMNKENNHGLYAFQETGVC